MESTNQQKLPIYQHRNTILDAIQKGRVTVISGKTGCGKSTQVPKYIMEYYPQAKLAVCQPRRLAATSLAYRVSEELKSDLGTTVGYQIGMDSKFCPSTQIKFITYGILIQELLFHQKIQYSHIILDEVHERSLQMDFLFIALRNLLDEPKNKEIKLIIMSATLKSEDFANYFATDKDTTNFYRPQIQYILKQQKQRYRGRRQKQQNNCTKKIKLKVEIKTDHQKYEPCTAISLPDKNKYKITEYFIDEVTMNESDYPTYYMNEDVRISDSTYKMAVYLIDQFLFRQQQGDLLVFVPGMQQIKKLKLFIQNKCEKYLQQKSAKIIQVHSAYSEQLHQLLFVQKVLNKIIIATNIGESSITLPSCKIVIDFCLTRKNISVKMKGYSRFETRVASKANLLQRAGRVGRTADGQVYRLIKKQQYATLTDFDIPQIQCVKLQMVILRAKQIDAICNSTLFQDPYQVFLNAIQPPQISDIHDAIECLVLEQALIYKNQIEQKQQKIKNQKEQIHKYEGKHLRLSPIGQFMVGMPCTIKISKCILLSLQFGITKAITSIASILMSPKKFFIHEQRMFNVEQFMHNMIKADQGRFNDFYLRHNLFTEWRQIFYAKFKEGKSNQINQQKPEEVLVNNPNIQDKESKQMFFSVKFNENSQIQAVLEQFCNIKHSQEQMNWCNQRAISAMTLRQILKIYENIKARLQKININIDETLNKVDNQLIILCFSIAFEQCICEVQWDYKKMEIHKKDAQNFISLLPKNFHQKDIQDYLRTDDNIVFDEIYGGYLKIQSSPQNLSKFLLPHQYSKANTQKTSQFYKYLAASDRRAVYSWQLADVQQNGRGLIVLNQSINKSLVKASPTSQYYLIAEKIFESKGRYFLGESALVERKLMLLIQMITAKTLSLQFHQSKQFIEKIIIGQKSIQIPFWLSNTDIKNIIQIRQLYLWQKKHIIEYKKEQSALKRQKLLLTLRNINQKPMLQTWNYIYDIKIKDYPGKNQQKAIFQIDICPLLKQNIFEGNSTFNIKNVGYFREYYAWKQKYYYQLYHLFRAMTIREPQIICASCYPKRITTIDSLTAYSHENKTLQLNQYRGDWKKIDNILYCQNKHEVGLAISQDIASISYDKLLIYIPYARTVEFDEQIDDQYIEQIKQACKQGLQQLQKQQALIQSLECKICCQFNQHVLDECIMINKKQVEKDEKQTTKAFWNKVSSHMYSKHHLKNCDMFLKNI